jgi:hypothetical protein
MNMRNLRSLFVALVVAALAAPASAQNIDKAIDAYKAGNHADAASMFYAVLQFSEEPGVIVEAQYGLAASFEKMGLPLAAQQYYEAIVGEGADHPYFDKAIEGLLDVADALDDDFKIPPVIDAMYDVPANQGTLAKMKPEILQRVHFHVGRNSFRREKIADARDFLKTVKEGNPAYARAQYLLGLIRLGVGRPDAPPPKYDKAAKHFKNVRNAIGKDAEAAPAQRLYDLATLALARAHYEEAYQLDDGDPKRTRLLNKAVAEYRIVPRFGGAWADALFERAWAHTVANEYGKALGALHSLSAPYFEDEFYPEGQILKSIIYYYNCQWDRVNRTLDETKARYQPMVAQMTDILETNYELDEWYALLGKSVKEGQASQDARLIPYLVARRIQKDPQFAKFDSYLREIEREIAFFEGDSAFNKSEMGRQLAEEFANVREAFVQLTGRLVKTKLRDLNSELDSITTRASIVSLETKTAETEWLELGKAIEGGVRSRLPRPFIPNDTFQFWWFRDEYWIDELGFYEYTVKTECIE